jgi:hypothetical protein
LRERPVHDYLESTLRLTSAILVSWGEVFPEKGVVGVAAAMEVEEGRKGGGLHLVAIRISLSNLL